MEKDMKEHHVTYAVISTEPGFKWKVGKDHYHTQDEAWERAKQLAKKDRCVAILHGKDGSIKTTHSYRWENYGKIDVPKGKAWYEE
jgi:hypothetical protein